MSSSSVGNIHIGLFVNTQGARAFTTAAGQIDKDSARMRQALGGTTKSVGTLRSAMNQNMRSRFLSDAVRQAALANNEIGKLRAAMLALTAITGTSVTGAFAGTYLLQTADQANRINNQLRTVTESEAELLAVRQKLHDISQLTRSDMQATVTLFARNTRAAREFGATQQQMLDVAESIQKAFAIGGASAQEAMGAAIQLSQGIASNRFSGEEYRSVSENAPVLLQEMAKYLDVSIGKLREMAHAGELTGEVVVNAILGAKKAIDEDFNKTVPTVGQAFTRVQNAILKYTAEADSSYGATRRLAEALSGLAENIDEVAEAGQVLAAISLAAFVGNRAGKGLGSLWSGLVPSSAEKNAIRDLTKSITSERMKIQKEMAAIRTSLAVSTPASGVGPVRPNAFVRSAAEENAKAVAVALQRQIAAEAALVRAQTAKVVNADRVAAAQKRVQSATEKLSATEGLAASASARAATERVRALRQLATLRQRDIALVGQQAAATQRLSMATRGMALAQRAASATLSVFGGPAGILLMAATLGIMKYADNAMKAQERTASLKRELHSLGLISDSVAGVVERAAQSLEELGAAELRNRLAEIRAEIERIRSSQGLFDQVFQYDPQMLGNAIEQLGRIQAGFTPDGKGVNTLTPDQRQASGLLETLLRQAQAGGVEVDVLISKLDLLAQRNEDMPPWFFEMIENMKIAIPYMDGLISRSEQLDRQLKSLNASGISTAWVQNIAAQQAELEAFAKGAEAIREIADEKLRVLKLSEDEARIEEIMNTLRKDAKDLAGEDAKIQDATLRMQAKRILLVEKGVAAEKDRADAQKKSAEALKNYLDTVSSMEREIARYAESYNEGDRAAAAMISTLLDGFRKGSISADHLHSELSAIGKTNLSGGMIDLIAKLQGAIPLAANLLNFLGRIAGISVGSIDPTRLIEDFSAQQIANSKLTPDQQYRKSLIDGYISEDLGSGIKMTRDRAEALADEVIRNEKAVEAMGNSMKGAAKDGEKFAEGMANLRRELEAAPLSDFEQQVLASAESMGISKAELDAYVTTVRSGGLAAAPQKFRDIADAMREISAINIQKDLQFEFDQTLRGPVEQRVFETLKTSGIEFNSVQGQMIASQIRLNESMKEMKTLASSVLKGFVADLKQGVSWSEALMNAFSKIGDHFLDKALDGLVDNLFGVFGNSPSVAPGAMGGQSGNGFWGDAIFSLPGAVEAGAKAGTQSGSAGGILAALKGQGGAISAGLGGLGIGVSTANPLMGGLGGALQGFVAMGGNPLGAVIGGIAGVVGGLFGMNAELEKAKQKLNEARPALEKMMMAMNGEKISSYAAAFADYEKQVIEARALAWAAGDGDYARKLQDSFERLQGTMGKALNDEIERNILALSGMEYVNQAADALDQFNMRMKDAAFLLTDAPKAGEELTLTLQKIIDESKLTADQISDLAVRFPDLANALGMVKPYIDELVNGLSPERLFAMVEEANRAVESARSDLRTAYDAEARSLKEVIDRTRAYIGSLQQFRDGLRLDSNLSPLSQWERFQEAQRRFADVSQKALGGDANALADLEDVSRDYLTEARAYYRNSETYFAIFKEVETLLDQALAVSGGQLTEAEKQLATLDKQVGLLIDLNSGVMSVAQAIANLTNVMALQQAANNNYNTGSGYSQDVMGLYRDVLGRAPDAQGAAYWQSKIAGGMTGDELYRQFIGTALGAGESPLTSAVAKWGIPGYADGTSFHPGGLAWVGERGPELLNLPRGAQVYPTGASMQMAAANGNGSADVVRELQQLRDELRQELAQLRAERRQGDQIASSNVEATRSVAKAVSDNGQAARLAAMRKAG